MLENSRLWLPWVASASIPALRQPFSNRTSAVISYIVQHAMPQGRLLALSHSIHSQQGRGCWDDCCLQCIGPAATQQTNIFRRGNHQQDESVVGRVAFALPHYSRALKTCMPGFEFAWTCPVRCLGSVHHSLVAYQITAAVYWRAPGCRWCLGDVIHRP